MIKHTIPIHTRTNFLTSVAHRDVNEWRRRLLELKGGGEGQGWQTFYNSCMYKKKNAYLQINPEAEEWVECSVCVCVCVSGGGGLALYEDQSMSSEI